jgi:translation initiation factor IF-3
MEPFVVEYASFNITRLIDQNNNFFPNMRIGEAKKMAKEASLQLVCFAEPKQNELALCKIINFGKWKYSKEKSEHKIKKEHKHDVKEIRFSPMTDEHDLVHKVNKVKEFLADGHEVLLALVCKRDQRKIYKFGVEKLNAVLQSLENINVIFRKENFPNNVQVKIIKSAKQG